MNIEKKLETIVAICSQDITDRIYRILSKVITNMEMELKQYLFHISEAPDASTIQDTIQPLFIFLDNQLSPYTELLIRLNLTRYISTYFARNTERSDNSIQIYDSYEQ
ncbi:unnamed protein product [Rotaria sp. Silwood1]|nr:unnamed protein product [Rotaria sp. Silwood1]